MGAKDVGENITQGYVARLYHFVVNDLRGAHCAQACKALPGPRNSAFAIAGPIGTPTT